MPRKPEVPCNRCGCLGWASRTCLPPGQYRCRPCRREEPQGYEPSPEKWTQTPCATCGVAVVHLVRKPRSFCSRACSSRRAGSTTDPYYKRARKAPGLSDKARSKLLTHWRKQGKRCAYCPGPPETLDHVIPLQRGGTNYEGNLVPCCRRCNGSKTDRLIVEWFNGRPRSHTISPRGRPRVSPKRRPELVMVLLTACPICDVIHGRNTSTGTCSHDCALESHARRAREKYRAAHGIQLEPDAPSRPSKRTKVLSRTS